MLDGKKVREVEDRRGRMEKVQTTIRLPAELKEMLAQEASKRGYTIKDLVIIILSEYFEKANSQE